ncbi:MAG: ssDNA-binding domain-containing protein [Bacteroidales bacterium]|nr:ssDNA-binding domain-containing protein [Bacteroidales bacterium]
MATKTSKRNGMALTDKSAEYLTKFFTGLIDKGEQFKWEQPWSVKAIGLPPTNVNNPKGYNLLNSFILSMECEENGYKSPFFITLDALRAKGCHLLTHPETFKRKDGTEYERDVAEHPCPVFQTFVRRRDADGNVVTREQFESMTEEQQQDVREFWINTIEWVYNLDQTTFPSDYPQQYAAYVELATAEMERAKASHVANVSDATLDFILNTKGAWLCPIDHDGKGKAFFTHGGGVHLPIRETFKTASAYYGTALHEMAHSTKEHGCPRNYGRKRWGDEGYATEELVAELSSAIVMHDLGLEKTIDQEHIAYVQAWKKSISDTDKLAVIMEDIIRCSKRILRHYENTAAMLSMKAAA